MGQLEQYDLDLPAGTVNDGLKRIEPILTPIYNALCERNRQGSFHQADETRWRVFVIFDGKKGYGWWLWMVLGEDTVIYRTRNSRMVERRDTARVLITPQRVAVAAPDLVNASSMRNRAKVATKR